jgi:hypothetical protein
VDWLFVSTILYWLSCISIAGLASRREFLCWRCDDKLEIGFLVCVLVSYLTYLAYLTCFFSPCLLACSLSGLFFCLPYLPSLASSYLSYLTFHPIYSPYLPFFLTIPSTISSPHLTLPPLLLLLPSLLYVSSSSSSSSSTTNMQLAPSFFRSLHILTYILTTIHRLIEEMPVGISGLWSGRHRERSGVMEPPMEGALACVSALGEM